MSEGVFDPEVYGEPVYSDTLFDTEVYGELLDEVSGATNVHGQAQAQIIAFDIEACGQAQAEIKQTYQGYGQCQAQIKQTYQEYSQVQAQIINTYQIYGQAQALIIPTRVYGQAQGNINQTYQSYGQVQAFITSGTNVFAQAQAVIRFGPVVIENMFANAHTYTVIEGSTTDIAIDFTTYTVEITDPDPFYETQFPADGTWASSFNGPNGWFYLTLLQHQVIEIDTLKQAVYTANDFDPDTVLGIFTGASGPGAWESLTHQGTIHQGADDATTIFIPGFTVWQSKIVITLDAGTYLFIVGEYASSSIKTFNLHIGVHAPQNYGNAQARIKAVGRGFGQAQAYIRPRVGLGQARARIKVVGNNKHAQSQAFIRANTAFGQAQSFIIKLKGLGQAQADILQTYQNYAQARTKIVPYLNVWAQVNADIKAVINKFAQAQAFIVITKASGQAQARIAVINSQGYGQAQAQIEPEKRYGQAQAYIIGNVSSCGQAQAFILKNKGHSQAQARIKVLNNQSYAQSQARIKLTAGYGQARARVLRNNTQNYGQAQALLPFTISPFGQAQAYIINPLVFGQAQADIIIHDIRWHGQANASIAQRTRRYGQTQGYITGYGVVKGGQAQVYITRAKNVHGQAQAYIQISSTKSGQAQAFVTTTRPVGQSQAVIATERYLAKFNGYQLPGYVQEESIESLMRVKKYGSPYRDFSFTEYEGLSNKNISLRILVVGENYLDCKNQIQFATTLLRTKRDGFANLYIQYYDRHFEALTKEITTTASVANIRTSEYTIEFETKPWIISDLTTTVSGTAIIETIGRTIDNGGWTPATVEFTGTDVTVSGYTSTGDFTGFVTVSGSIVDYTVDEEIFVGPGVTYFEITGATDCTITYNDRWYL